MDQAKVREWAAATMSKLVGPATIASGYQVGKLESAARELVDEVVEELEAKLKAVPRAHTYASENADLYRGFDNGIARAIEIVRALKVQP